MVSQKKPPKLLKPIYRFVVHKPWALPFLFALIGVLAILLLKEQLSNNAMIALSSLGIAVLGILYMTLNGIQWHLERNKTLLEELHKQNDALEENVDNRTHELKSQNLQLEETMQHLKEAQEKLILQERMASIGMLTAGIAHEIKNPLNFINNFSDITVELVNELKEVLDTVESIPTEVKEDLSAILEDISTNCNKINEHGKRAESTIKNMLIQSRSQKDEKSKTDINKLVEEYLNLAYHGMRAQDADFNVKIVKELKPNLTEVVVSQQTIGRVVLNIINNGFYAANEKREKNPNLPKDFMPTVTVKTDEDDFKIYIHIKDNGIGMTQETKKKIFQAFFTTKPIGVGTGLGLAICHEIIVDDHKGELKVDSVVGEYTEFVIALPKDNKK
ncbi:sensor histidine kinase [Candidatus Berkiella cookevillensis]|uniref:histidine kinase n=2 Tax=Candidatus Berkiella cookevillensis TaxID=437022 RepID=A0AAE3L5J1_9GAMM|nr:ATP-binding protein [Candidatus Berkiella cookevillensis]MCS5707910.1 sensor histidine kinase [Candidatus Berkiella cookevillensis]